MYLCTIQTTVGSDSPESDLFTIESHLIDPIPVKLMENDIEKHALSSNTIQTLKSSNDFKNNMFQSQSSWVLRHLNLTKIQRYPVKSSIYFIAIPFEISQNPDSRCLIVLTRNEAKFHENDKKCISCLIYYLSTCLNYYHLTPPMVFKQEINAESFRNEISGLNKEIIGLKQRETKLTSDVFSLLEDFCNVKSYSHKNNLQVKTESGHEIKSLIFSILSSLYRTNDVKIWFCDTRSSHDNNDNDICRIFNDLESSESNFINLHKNQINLLSLSKSCHLIFWISNTSLYNFQKVSTLLSRNRQSTSIDQIYEDMFDQSLFDINSRDEVTGNANRSNNFSNTELYEKRLNFIIKNEIISSEGLTDSKYIKVSTLLPSGISDIINLASIERKQSSIPASTVMSYSLEHVMHTAKLSIVQRFIFNYLSHRNSIHLLSKSHDEDLIEVKRNLEVDLVRLNSELLDLKSFNQHLKVTYERDSMKSKLKYDELLFYKQKCFDVYADMCRNTISTVNTSISKNLYDGNEKERNLSTERYSNGLNAFISNYLLTSPTNQDTQLDKSTKNRLVWTNNDWIQYLYSQDCFFTDLNDFNKDFYRIHVGKFLSL